MVMAVVLLVPVLEMWNLNLPYLPNPRREGHHTSSNYRIGSRATHRNRHKSNSSFLLGWNPFSDYVVNHVANVAGGEKSNPNPSQQ